MKLSWANFSDDGVYRYDLFRRIQSAGEDDGTTLTVVMLNPSTADASKDDPTIRRLIGFAKKWRCSFLHVLNLFAFRATDPRLMLVAADPVGPSNDAFITKALTAAKNKGEWVLAAWGAHGGYLSRHFHVRHRLVEGVDWRCFGLTHSGQPKHPLYVPSIVEPRQFL